MMDKKKNNAEISGNEVELTEKKEKKIAGVKAELSQEATSSNETTTKIKFSPCVLGFQLLGLRGLFGLIIALAIGVLMLYAYFTFDNKSQWYILVVAIGAFLLPILYIYKIHKQIEMITLNFKRREKTPIEKSDDSDNENSNEEENRKSFKRKASEAVKNVGLRYYNTTDPNGKYYITKTYISEMFEYVSQSIALSFYTCNLPLEIVVIVYFVLLFEGVIVGIDTMYTIKHGISVRRRNNKVMLDITLEVLSASVPLLLMRFAYGLQFTEEEFFILGVVPALFSLSKLYEIVDAIIRERGVIFLKRYREKDVKARRLSFFTSWRSMTEENENEKVEKEQMENTPKIIHYVFLFVVFLYSVFLTVTISVQLATVNNVNCSNEISPVIWEGCTVKLYFCNNIFSPQCNCAFVEIKKHNMTTLPDPTFKLDALKRFKVNHGPLKTLQPEIKNLKRLAALDLSYNMIQNVPETISSLAFLLSLRLANNELNELSSKIWGMGLVYLELDNNNISQISKNISSALILSQLLLSNNTLQELPKELGSTNLRYVMLDGNNLKSIPDHIVNLKKSLVVLHAQNQNLTYLPKDLGSLINLKILDVRNNSLTMLPDSVKNLKRMEYLYLYANPLCSNGWMEMAPEEVKEMAEKRKGEEDQAGCAKQCSPYCQNRFLNYKICGRDCNSKECEYQKGACKV